VTQKDNRVINIVITETSTESGEIKLFVIQQKVIMWSVDKKASQHPTKKKLIGQLNKKQHRSQQKHYLKNQKQ
jgi:hypothetical protein